MLVCVNAGIRGRTRCAPTSLIVIFRKNVAVLVAIRPLFGVANHRFSTREKIVMCCATKRGTTRFARQTEHRQTVVLQSKMES